MPFKPITIIIMIISPKPQIPTKWDRLPESYFSTLQVYDNPFVKLYIIKSFVIIFKQTFIRIPVFLLIVVWHCHFTSQLPVMVSQIHGQTFQRFSVLIVIQCYRQIIFSSYPIDIFKAVLPHPSTPHEQTHRYIRKPGQK